MSSYILPRKIQRFEIFRPGMPLKTWLDRQTDKPDILLNCSLYHANGKPIGTIIADGKMVNNSGGGFGFGTADGFSVGFGGPWSKAWKEYVTGYYGIVQHGKAVSKPWSDGYVFNQKLSRIAFGQLKDGRYAVFTANGVNIDQMAVQGVQAGFESLCNLDGGGSAIMVFDGKIINRPSGNGDARKLLDMIVIGEYLDGGELHGVTPSPVPTATTEGAGN